MTTESSRGRRRHGAAVPVNRRVGLLAPAFDAAWASDSSGRCRLAGDDTRQLDRAGAHSSSSSNAATWRVSTFCTGVGYMARCRRTKRPCSRPAVRGVPTVRFERAHESASASTKQHQTMITQVRRACDASAPAPPVARYGPRPACAARCHWSVRSACAIRPRRTEPYRPLRRPTSPRRGVRYGGRRLSRCRDWLAQLHHLERDDRRRDCPDEPTAAPTCRWTTSTATRSNSWMAVRASRGAVPTFPPKWDVGPAVDRGRARAGVGPAPVLRAGRRLRPCHRPDHRGPVLARGAVVLHLRRGHHRRHQGDRAGRGDPAAA